MPRLLGLTLSCLTLAGCQQFLAERMVAPPNGNIHIGEPSATTTSSRQRLEIDVGPPTARLVAWVQSPESPPRGTVLLLHGFLNNHAQLAGAAEAFRAAGYRTVLVDLRGHGRSSGKHISYGVFDARDLAQLLDALQQRGLCDARIGIFGTSYGAASGILLAGSDPRVAAVVAVAPYASLRQEAPHFGRTLLPLPGALLSDDQYTEILDRAGKLAGFNPDEASPENAIRKTAAKILLIHGELDAITPADASRQLHAAAPDISKLMVLPGKGHLGLSFDLFGELHPIACDWFNRNLAVP